MLCHFCIILYQYRKNNKVYIYAKEAAEAAPFAYSEYQYSNFHMYLL